MSTPDEEEKGRQFLELIDKQNTLQQAIVAKLTRLVTEYKWNSEQIRGELSDLVYEHSEVTRKINGLEP